YLNRTMTLEAAIASTILQVRRYARRQLTWFRADPRVQWIAPEIELGLARLQPGIMGSEAS
nr:hypothetical protein [Candidatus Dormibacteraeota bacterium]